MSERYKLIHCEKCKLITLHLVSGSGNKGMCEDCGTEFDRSAEVERQISQDELRSGELFEKIQGCIESDDESWEKKGRRLLDDWCVANEREREVMDNMLITMCGWSLTTIIRDMKLGGE